MSTQDQSPPLRASDERASTYEPSEDVVTDHEPTPPPYPCPGWSASEDDGSWVWVLAPDEWKAGGGPYTCRDRGCLRPAVMRLNRWQHRRGKGRVPMWWHYCAEHAFSRVVHDGAVWQPGRSEETCAECGVRRADHKPPTMDTHYFREAVQ